MATTVLLKLAGLTNDLRTIDIAHQALAQMQTKLAQYPLGFGQWLQALACTLSKPHEIAIIGEPEGTDTRALLNVVRNGYQPFQVVALGEPAIDDVQLARLRQLPSNAADRVGCIAAVPLLRDRGLLDRQAAAYVRRARSRARLRLPGVRHRARQATGRTGTAIILDVVNRTLRAYTELQDHSAWVCSLCWYRPQKSKVTLLARTSEVCYHPLSLASLGES